MQQVPIQALPAQEFTIFLDNKNWDVLIRTTNGVMSVTLRLDGTTVIENMRVVAGAPVIPSQYEESGNFLFLTQDFQMPDYTLFGTTQSLIYVGAAELAALRAPVAPPITAAYFSPIAAPPLRFAPSGYISA